MKVVFRVDASTRMGTGHLMRCLTLAEALRARGTRARFLCRAHRGHLMHLVQERGMPVAALPGPAVDDDTRSEDYASWLGATQAEDAKQTLDAMNGETPDWLVVDHYGLDIDWERRIKPHVGKLMVIDDLANRGHDCDLLLDQNFAIEGKRRYDGLVPDECRLLTGPRYALLGTEYAGYRKALRSHRKEIKTILVFFGGSDPHNMTGVALEAIASTDLCNAEVNVVIGANNLHRQPIERQAAAAPNIEVHGPLPNLADLIAQADLAIGAAGATTWERMCLGLPSVVVSIAENQRPAAEALAAARLIYYTGHVSDITATRLAQHLQQLSHAPEELSELSTRCQLQVDGLGALRMVEVLCPSASEEIRLRSARTEDVVGYYDWAHDPVVRQNAIDVSTFSWASHQAWFAAKLRSADSRLFVLEAAGLPVGQIRFDTQSGEARIDYSLDEIVRGRGWAARLVALGIERMRQTSPIRLCAVVKTENKASRSVFLRLGFTASETPSGDLTVYCLDPATAGERQLRAAYQQNSPY